MVQILKKIKGKKIDLVFDEFIEENIEKGYPPAIMYNIVLKATKEIVGHCSAKIGYNEILYYAGHVGFSVKEEFRGNGYATEAVNLIKKVFKLNKMSWIYITNNPDNNASVRVCEKVGAKFVKMMEFPEQDLKRFAVQDSYKNIWELNL